MNVALLARVPPRIPTSGLVAFYDFVQGSDPQTLYDQSGAAQHARLGNSSAIESADPLWTTQGLLFDGNDDLVTTPAIALGSTYTLLSIFTPTDFTAWRVAIGSDSTAAYCGCRIDNGYPILTTTQAGNFNQQSVIANTPATVGKPNFIVGRVGTNTLDLFLGAYRIASSTAVPSASRTLATIGRNGVSGFNTMKGTIHLVAAYNRPLLNSEVSALYRSLRAPFSRRGILI